MALLVEPAASKEMGRDGSASPSLCLAWPLSGVIGYLMQVGWSAPCIILEDLGERLL